MKRSGIEEGICRKCAKPVTWERLFSGKYAPPWEPTGYGVNVFIDDDFGPRIEYWPEYEQHRCTEKDIKTHETYKKLWDEKKAARDKLRDQARRLALEDAAPRPCPRCEAPAYRPCTNLSRQDKKRFGTPNAWPHQERQSEGFMQGVVEREPHLTRRKK